MILRIADTGDVLGMSAALSNDDYEVTAEVLQPCRVRVLHIKHLTTMLQTYSDATTGATRIACRACRPPAPGLGRRCQEEFERLHHHATDA